MVFARNALAALAAIVIFAGAGAATAADCPADPAQVGAPATLPDVYAEAQRIAVTTVIYEALRAPATEPRPERDLAKRNGCALSTFDAGKDRFTLHSSASPGPVRWATSDTSGLAFYVAAGRRGPSATDLGLKHQPFALAMVVDGGRERIQQVLRLFDGQPSDRMIEEAIRESLTSGGFAPLAAYDSEGDAVTLFRATLSHRAAQLFGPPPRGDRTAAILLPDGTYFREGRDGDAVMRDIGIACPGQLGPLEHRQLIVVESDPLLQDLACQYASHDVWISIFVERLPKADLADYFETQRAEMKKDYKDPKDTPQLVGVNGPTHFQHGASWIGADEIAGGLWVGRKGDYIIEVDGKWTIDSYRDARAAIKAFDPLAFGPSPSPAPPGGRP